MSSQWSITQKKIFITKVIYIRNKLLGDFFICNRISSRNNILKIFSLLNQRVIIILIIWYNLFPWILKIPKFKIYKGGYWSVQPFWIKTISISIYKKPFSFFNVKSFERILFRREKIQPDHSKYETTNFWKPWVITEWKVGE